MDYRSRPLAQGEHSASGKPRSHQALDEQASHSQGSHQRTIGILGYSRSEVCSWARAYSRAMPAMGHLLRDRRSDGRTHRISA